VRSAGGCLFSSMPARHDYPVNNADKLCWLVAAERVEEITRITDLRTGKTTETRRVVCWSPEDPDIANDQDWKRRRDTHYCHLAARHSGRHQDKCCEHDTVEWD